MIDLARPGSNVNGFLIERELGRGGMGVVYLAEQVNLSRKVALKVISPQLADDPGFKARFEREARLAASLDHPNVVPVFEAGSGDELLYLAMRYVRGTDLGAVIRSEGRLDAVRAGHIVSQLGAALDDAHANGLIHRDVKPGNVLLAAGDDEHVYLTDFGLTKEAGVQSAQLTNTGQWVGTVDYVAPEQLESGHHIDARTDVYSLGCVLFEMLSGRVPYEGTSLQKMWGHGSSAAPSLSGIDAELADRFDPIIGRAMAKRPDDRYQSAGDLGRAASAAAHGRPVTVPERSVAAGAAAEGSIESGTAAVLNQPSRAGTKIERNPPPRTEQAVRRPLAPPPPALTAPAAIPSLPRRRSRLLIPAAVVVALLAVAGIGALMASRGDHTEPPAAGAEKAKATVTRPQGTSKSKTDKPKSTERAGAEPAASPPSAAPETAQTSFEQYTPSSSGYSTQIPTGPDWSTPSETQPSTTGTLYRTTITGPDGLIVLIDYTPSEPAGFGAGADSVRRVDQAAFGSATEYIFSGGSIPQCADSQCIDYIVNDSSRGGGYGILAGGSPDFGLARRVAERIMQSLAYNDY